MTFPEDEALRPLPRLDRAVEAYRDRFGVAPGTFRLRRLGRDAELAEVIEQAVRDGVPLDMEVVEARFGVPPDPLADAVGRYVARFGQGPPVWQFMGRQKALTREILAAVARGEMLTDTELYRRLGMTPPPPGVEL